MPKCFFAGQAFICTQHPESLTFLWQIESVTDRLHCHLEDPGWKFTRNAICQQLITRTLESLHILAALNQGDGRFCVSTTNSSPLDKWNHLALASDINHRSWMEQMWGGRKPSTASFWWDNRNARRCSSSTHSGIFIIGRLEPPLSLLFPRTYKQLGSSTGLCLRADEPILQLQTGGESYLYLYSAARLKVRGEQIYSTYMWMVVVVGVQYGRCKTFISLTSTAEPNFNVVVFWRYYLHSRHLD